MVSTLVLVLAMIFWAVPTVSADITNGLIGWWKLNEGSGTTAVDSSGGGHDGTLTNGPTWIAGKRGLAVNFDGNNDYVEIASSSAVADNLPDFSVSCWFKTSAAPYNSGGSPIVMKTNSNITGGIGWMITIGDSDTFSPTGSVAAFVQGPTASDWVGRNTTALYNDGIWHHVVMTFSGSNTMVLYVDGSSAGTNDDSGGTIGSYSNASNIKIASDTTLGEYFNGIVDDMRVYNRALSATEASALYNLPIASNTGGAHIGGGHIAGGE